MTMTTFEALSRRTQRIRYAWSPRLIFAELLLKQWFEPVIPFTVMIALAVYFSLVIPDYGSVKNAVSLARLFAEFGFVALGMTLTLISGGIDLSVGAIFAIANFTALFCMFVLDFPVWLTVIATLLTGAVVGAANGVLIGYLKARPFLTTLVMLIILRASVNLLNGRYATVFATNSIDSDAWDYLSDGTILGVPVNAATLIVVLLIGHIFLSRSRYGWHLTAIGASRKAARHAGIRVERILLVTYMLSGMLCALGGVFYAARQGSTDSTTGLGWEFQAVTAVVLGGASVVGGRGTVWRAMIGAIIIFVLTNGLVRMGIPGYITSAAYGIILLVAVSIDVKWAKNRGKVIQKTYVNPARVPLSTSPTIARDSQSALAQNDRLIHAEAIGLDQVEGPEDVIIDRQDRVYGSTRDGNIIRFSGPNLEKREIFAHIGGRPLGMQFDKDENLIVCVAGMGVYGVKPDGEVFKVTDETNRTWYKLNDNSRLRMADDLDIAPDGKIYFSDCTTRYEMTTNALDIIEGRPNGRLVVYDPRNQEDRDADLAFLLPERHLRLARRPVGADRQYDAVQDLSLLDRRAAQGTTRGRDRRTAGQSRQHQPRIGRHLLAGTGRHPHAHLRPRRAEARLPAAHGQAGAGRRMAGARAEPRLRAAFQRSRRHSRILLGPDRHLALDTDIDARAQGLPLSRGPREQSHRPRQA